MFLSNPEVKESEKMIFYEFFGFIQYHMVVPSTPIICLFSLVMISSTVGGLLELAGEIASVEGLHSLDDNL